VFDISDRCRPDKPDIREADINRTKQTFLVLVNLDEAGKREALEICRASKRRPLGGADMSDVVIGMFLIGF
jgi:hypothetical protein